MGKVADTSQDWTFYFYFKKKDWKYVTNDYSLNKSLRKIQYRILVLKLNFEP